MPRQGYKTITVSEDIVELLDDVYHQYRKKLKRQGILTKQQFILAAIRKYAEDLEKEEELASKGGGAS